MGIDRFSKSMLLVELKTLKYDINSMNSWLQRNVLSSYDVTTKTVSLDAGDVAKNQPTDVSC